MTKPESSKAPANKREPKLQTITLKVFIHCEGCRRKIRHIIRVLDGVENVVVDSATGKVTITGTEIDVKVILQRLQKHGKQAEVWPTGNAVAKSEAANQPKQSNGNSPSTLNTNAKKSENAVGDGKAEGAKPAGPSGNGGKKGIGKKNKESTVADQIVDGNEGGGKNESIEAEKSKETDVADVDEAGDSRSPQGNEGNGGGAGKKGKKGGSGSNNGSSSGADGVPQRPRPPPLHHVQDIPITSLPVTTTITVSANRAPAPYNYIQTGYSEYQSVDYATHMFSDENANNCSIM